MSKKIKMISAAIISFLFLVVFLSVFSMNPTIHVNRSRTAEAKITLHNMYGGQKNHFKAHGRYSLRLDEIQYFREQANFYWVGFPPHCSGTHPTQSFSPATFSSWRERENGERNPAEEAKDAIQEYVKGLPCSTDLSKGYIAYAVGVLQTGDPRRVDAWSIDESKNLQNLKNGVYGTPLERAKAALFGLLRIK